MSFYYNNKDNNTLYSVAGLIIDNLDKIPYSTIAELADLCYTAPSTISRLVKKFGCNSFPEFRSNVANELSEYRFSYRPVPYQLSSKMRDHWDLFFDYMRDIIDSLEKNYNADIINNILDFLHVASKLFLYGNIVSESARLCFLNNFAILAKKKAYLIDSNKPNSVDYKNIDGNSVLFTAFTDAKQPQSVYRLMQIAKDNNAKIISISPPNIPDLSHFADCILEITLPQTSMDYIVYDMYLGLITVAYRNKYID
jgi:DNA-binding MurR/RpiR family transcriptional regulator